MRVAYYGFSPSPAGKGFDVVLVDKPNAPSTKGQTTCPVFTARTQREAVEFVTAGNERLAAIIRSGKPLAAA